MTALYAPAVPSPRRSAAVTPSLRTQTCASCPPLQQAHLVPSPTARAPSIVAIRSTSQAGKTVGSWAWIFGAALVKLWLYNTYGV